MKIINGLDAVGEYLGIKIPAELYEVEKIYPVRAGSCYLDLIDRQQPFTDPVWKQCMPHPGELSEHNASPDPLAEERQTVAPRLIRRFKDRVVLLVTNRCPMYCRFCFRKRLWRSGEPERDISGKELEAALDYCRKHPDVREILISGGEPLMLDNSHLGAILERISTVPSLEIIRLGSRAPATWPERFDQELVALLAGYPGLWVATHFNHPGELSPAAVEACSNLIRSGVPVVNQTVLLRGVNDRPEVLEQLFRALIRIRVKPHYLFHVDPVRGVRHFATGIARGMEILRYFRPRLSSLATPLFAIDLPEGGGKVHLQENYFDGKRFESIFDFKVEYPDGGLNPIQFKTGGADANHVAGHHSDAESAAAEIHAAANPEKAAGMMRFFRTGPGEYAEGDIFLGVNNPTIRRIVRKYRALPIAETVKLLQDRHHELRLCALLILVELYRQGNDDARKQILEVYLGNTRHVNNWDLVDLSAPGIVGEATLNGGHDIHDLLAGSSSLWDQRIAIVSTLTHIRHGKFSATLRLAERFLSHPHDLMHKACGWMLREAGKRNRDILTGFLRKYKSRMPRTMLRYAIEHYPEAERRGFLQK